MMTRPNILFIMTDQQRYDGVGANGNARIRTPNLDRLASQSANFSACFVQAPVCTPSRQTIFTSRYAHAHRNRVNYTPLDPPEILMQSYLQDAGYTTGVVGKLHYWPPTRDHALSTGFDHGLIHDAGPMNEHSDYVAWLEENSDFTADNFRACEAPTPGRNPYTSRIPDELHETTWCGRQSRKMLRELAAGEKPFFLFSSYWKPHAPFEIPEPWASMYDEVDFDLPATRTAEHIAGLPLPVQRLALRSDPADHEVDEETLQWRYRSYYAAISHLDREVGLTLDLLEELDLVHNTIIIFCSDHGDQLLEHGINGKNVFYESSIHIPMMIRYPRTVQAATYDDLVETTDLLPTLFDLSQVPIPPRAQGRSFAGLIAERAAAASVQEYIPRQHVFCENIIPEVITHRTLDMAYERGQGVAGIRHPDAKMVRTDRWKYCYYVGHGDELYDIAADAEETVNLAGDPAHQGTVRDMRDALLNWLITADEADQIAPRWCTRS